MRHNQLRSGVYLSYINLAISFVIPFVYTPVMLRLLGQAEYGLYSLSNSVIGYLTLLSFGFGTTIVRYIAKYRAEGRKREEEEAFGFFLMLYSALALLVMAGGMIVSFFADGIFEKGLTGGEISKMRILTLIMAFNTALSFPLSVFSSMAIAHERYFFRKVMDIVSTAAAPVANLIALYLGFASAGMALAATIVQLLLAPVSIFYCFRELKLRPRFVRLPGALVREMLGFSVFVFLGTLVDMLFWATDKVILGMLASTTAVAIYNVGGTFNNIVMQLSTSISGVLVPRITGMVITNTPKEEWSGLFIRIGRLQFLIIGLIVSGFSVFGRVFIDLWAGPEYADAFWVAVLTMFPLCIPLIQNTGLSIVVAQNKHQFRAVVYFVIAIANVISTYLIIPYMGVIGAALCSCVSYLLGQGIIMNIYYYKVTGLDIPRFWGNILRMAVVPGIMLAVGLLAMRHLTLDGWMPFLMGVAVYTAIYCLLMYVFAMNDYERDIIRKPFGKILNRFRRSEEDPMPKLAELDRCTGCTACAAVCPKGSIRMMPDADGFCHPAIDESTCIGCGLCEKVCPVLNPLALTHTPTAWAAWTGDDDSRMASTSGGVFPELAREILGQGGAVFGAAYDEHFRVVHICAENEQALDRLRGAKYAQSDLGDSFRDVKRRLEGGQQVLFSGTPCQVLGLKAFLRKEYDNLLTADLVCHSVPSPLAWEKYLQYISGEKEITNVNLRCKDTGWSRYRYSNRFAFSDGSHRMDGSGDSLYMKLFVGGYITRSSCECCPAKGHARGSDLTLGDFWGIWNSHPELDDDRGVSLVLAQTEKGLAALARLEKQAVSLEEATRENSAVIRAAAPNSRRPEAMELVRKGRFAEAAALLPPPPTHTAPSLLCRAVVLLKRKLWGK